MPLDGLIMNRFPERANAASWFQPPPRNTLNFPWAGPDGSVTSTAGYSPNQSRHHSQTLPCMSYRPHGLGRFRPTGCVLESLFSEVQAYWSASVSASPKLKWFVVPARQAYSHSASEGSR